VTLDVLDAVVKIFGGVEVDVMQELAYLSVDAARVLYGCEPGECLLEVLEIYGLAVGDIAGLAVRDELVKGTQDDLVETRADVVCFERCFQGLEVGGEFVADDA
jgi:hypothetical protein